MAPSLVRARLLSSAAAKDIVCINLILQRNPLAMLPLTQFEQEYEAYQQALQFERASVQPGIVLHRAAAGSASSAAVHAPRPELSLADPRRRPERMLFLLVADATDGQWRFPRVQYQPSAAGEHTPTDILQVLQAGCFLADDSTQQSGWQPIYYPATRPLAYWREAFTERVAPPLGAKHFYFKGQWTAGTLLVRNDAVSECAWLARDEIEEMRLPCYGAVEHLLAE